MGASQRTKGHTEGGGRMSLDGKGRRNKGANFERRVAADLREIFPEAKRGFQTRGGTAEAPDVDGTPFYIEAKAHKKVNREAAWLQAEEATDGRAAVAVCKDDRQKPVVVMRLSVAAQVAGWLDPLIEWDYERFLFALRHNAGPQ